MEVIKKYSNRKLYSTTLSKYVKLDYVLDLVRTKQKFMVIDDASKLDITSASKRKALMTMKLDDITVTSLIRGV